MKKSFYQFAALVIFISTILIAGGYLLSNREPATEIEPEISHTQTVAVPPENTPAPTSTPILPPIQNKLEGDKHYFNGDWENAILSYDATLAGAQTVEEGSGALLGLGKVYYQDGDYQKALDYLRLLVASYPDSPIIHKAYFALAQTYTALDRYLEAADAYNLYLERRPGILDAFI